MTFTIHSLQSFCFSTKDCIKLPRSRIVYLCTRKYDANLFSRLDSTTLLCLVFVPSQEEQLDA